MKRILIFIFLLPSLLYAQSEKVSEFACKAQQKDYEISVRIQDGQGEIEYKTPSGTVHKCSGKALVRDLSSSQYPHIEVKLPISQNCQPRLTIQTAKNFSGIIDLTYKIRNKTAQVRWLAYSEPVECVISSNDMQKALGLEK